MWLQCEHSIYKKAGYKTVSSEAGQNLGPDVCEDSIVPLYIQPTVYFHTGVTGILNYIKPGIRY
jgi:hypothetical protein